MFLVLILSLGLLITGCEVDEGGDVTESDTITANDTAEGDTVEETTANPCIEDNTCNVDDCALLGNYDPDCHALSCTAKGSQAGGHTEQNIDPEAKQIIDQWKADGYDYSDISACDWYSGICEAQFKDSNIACFCDADCTEGVEPCASDGHCDNWCPAGYDPDCD